MEGKGINVPIVKCTNEWYGVVYKQLAAGKSLLRKRIAARIAA